MDIKLVNALVATVLKVDVNGLEVSVSFSRKPGDAFAGDCRVYDADNKDLTHDILKRNFYYIDTLEELLMVCKKAEKYKGVCENDEENLKPITQ